VAQINLCSCWYLRPSSSRVLFVAGLFHPIDNLNVGRAPVHYTRIEDETL